MHVFWSFIRERVPLHRGIAHICTECATNFYSLLNLPPFCFCESHIQTIRGEYTQKTKIQKVKYPKMGLKMIFGYLIGPKMRTLQTIRALMNWLKSVRL